MYKTEGNFFFYIILIQLRFWFKILCDESFSLQVVTIVTLRIG